MHACLPAGAAVEDGHSGTGAKEGMQAVASHMPFRTHARRDVGPCAHGCRMTGWTTGRCSS